MGFVIFNCILLFIVVLLLLMLSAVWPPDSPWAPWWQTPNSIARFMCRYTNVYNKSVIYDLGCGTGHALVLAAKEFNARGFGIEIDPLRYWIAKMNIWRFGVSKNVIIIKENFFNISLEDATVLFIYLVPKTLENLAPKFLKELKRGTMIASYKYSLPVTLFNGKLLLIKHDKENEIFVYKLK